VDLKQDKSASIYDLVQRLDLVYAGTPRDHPMDRAFANMVEKFDMPRALPEALFEGFVWDAMSKQYKTFDDLISYSARVASSVGAMLCVIMGERRAEVLSRACDLGVAMQLTNIARDIGEDAKEGRLYVPHDWFQQEGLDPKEFLSDPNRSESTVVFTKRLLGKAETLYHRSEAGIAYLPPKVRPAMFAARHIYSAIGIEIKKNNYDNINYRARTNKFTKTKLLTFSALQSLASVVLPAPATVYAEPLPQTKFLVEAAKFQQTFEVNWSSRFVSVIEQLKTHDQKKVNA
jgi:phytoene synthase